MEKREEGVLESVEPVLVVVFEREAVAGGFLAREKREGAWHFCRKMMMSAVKWWRILGAVSGFSISWLSCCMENERKKEQSSEPVELSDGKMAGFAVTYWLIAPSWVAAFGDSYLSTISYGPGFVVSSHNIYSVMILFLGLKE